MADSFEFLRGEMVERQIKARGIVCERLLCAMGNIPRHLCVPKHLRALAYEDMPLPIGLGQTISQPFMVAFMTEKLGVFAGMKVLEIGAGSGYQAAVLAELGCEVFTIERKQALAENAKNTLETLGFGGVQVRHGDGYEGWPEEAPFDAIIVTAAPNYIPGNLVKQLKDGGKMVIPVGEVGREQWLKLITKDNEQFREEVLIPVRFVPMIETRN
ncbi:MAG: protein-L-isoaspartate(D-aspartate) O-methyltransferase [Clostridiales bacterium]|jgi:protein-L-isoaspartate(D-aspartate) O-methyltransferase|nr:protein-L-isoaspartate(D-aspartate) O-methyltransferase [Clostridiales bacterium]